MNQKLDLVIRHWLPLFAECNPGSTAVVKEFADKARKNDKIDAGMSAYPFLLMKSARNSYIHKSVIEYVKCVSYTNSIFHQIQILEAESESANEHFQICDEYKTLLQSLDDELDAEIKALRIATKRTTIEKRMAKAKTIVEKIQLCNSICLIFRSLGKTCEDN